MFIGNLGRDPEMRYTPNGRPVTQFSVAVSHSKPDGQGGWVDEGTDWFRVSVFGDRAERAAEQLRKGNRVFVEGRFKTREFEGQDGQKRTSLDVTADNVISLEARGRTTTAGPSPVPRRCRRRLGRRWRVLRRRRWRRLTPARRRHRPRRPSLLTQEKPNTCLPRPSQEARRLLPRSTPPQGLRVLRRQDRPDRLQGGQPPPPLPVRAGQDRAATQDRHVRRPPARAGGRPQARPPRRPAPVRAAAPPPLSRSR